MTPESILEDLRSRIPEDIKLELTKLWFPSDEIAPVEDLILVTSSSSDGKVNYTHQFSLFDAVALKNGETRVPEITDDDFRILAGKELKIIIRVLTIADDDEVELFATVKNVATLLDIINERTSRLLKIIELQSHEEWLLLTSSLLAGYPQQKNSVVGSNLHCDRNWGSWNDPRDRAITQALEKGDFVAIEGTQKPLTTLLQDHDPSKKKTWVNRECVFSVQSIFESGHLRCTVNPKGPCEGCSQFEPRSLHH